MSKRDSLSSEVIARDLQTRVLGRCVVYYERIGSTNDAARQLAEAGEPEGALVVADEQSAGRGRLGRSWVAPARSSLLMSLILRPDLPPRHAPRVTMAIALGACDAICTETGLPAQIKWPNDLQIRGKKFSGILAESGIVGEKLEYVIVGIGVNVNFDTAAIAGIPPDATSLATELGRVLPRAPLAQAIIRSIEAYYLRLRAGQSLCDEYKNRLATLGQSIRAQTAQGIVAGRAVDVDEDGALIVQRADDSLVQLQAGDVTLSHCEIAETRR
ncbi:MAG: biotin--[acetyl-CoA-carboxylase] ligase [Anaerolineales bacterium]|nr:biotin--[acetyl-CoA-carboxylase] ligase [Anaerolineales bacterium]